MLVTKVAKKLEEQILSKNLSTNNYNLKKLSKTEPRFMKIRQEEFLYINIAFNKIHYILEFNFLLIAVFDKKLNGKVKKQKSILPKTSLIYLLCKIRFRTYTSIRFSSVLWRSFQKLLFSKKCRKRKEMRKWKTSNIIYGTRYRRTNKCRLFWKKKKKMM